jgi:hypothetical protein
MVKAAPPDFQVRPLWDRTERFKPGKAAKIRFAAQKKSSGSPASVAGVSVAVIHAGQPMTQLPAEEVEPGVYEATFTPSGPGQYRFLLSSAGAPLPGVSPVLVGVVGAVGADPQPRAAVVVPGTAGGVNVLGSLAIDPETSRTRHYRRR